MRGRRAAAKYTLSSTSFARSVYFGGLREAGEERSVFVTVWLGPPPSVREAYLLQSDLGFDPGYVGPAQKEGMRYRSDPEDQNAAIGPDLLSET